GVCRSPLQILRACLQSVFFFQAEDGIRDWSVTGVQTCALPISRRSRRAGTENVAGIVGLGEALTRAAAALSTEVPRLSSLRDRRSEERRVGKERRARGAPGREVKKQRRRERVWCRRDARSPGRR